MLILGIPNTVLLPRTFIRISIPTESVDLNAILGHAKNPPPHLVVLPLGEGEILPDIGWIGCTARILKIATSVVQNERNEESAKNVILTLQGMERVQVDTLPESVKKMAEEGQYVVEFRSKVSPLPEVKESITDQEAIQLIVEVRKATSSLLAAIRHSLPLPDKVHDALHAMLLDDPSHAPHLSSKDSLTSAVYLSDALAGVIDPPFEDKYAILTCNHRVERVRMVLECAKNVEARVRFQNGVLNLMYGKKMLEEADKKKSKKPVVSGEEASVVKSNVRDRSKALGRTSSAKPRFGPGDGKYDDGDDDLADLMAKLAARQLPNHVRQAADRELKRLRGMPQQAAEHALIRNYLECLADVPWGPLVDAGQDVNMDVDLRKAQETMDADHAGLDSVKRRVLEFLAVMKLRARAKVVSSDGDKEESMIHTTPKGPILCLVGPPGVGKTSLGRSVARALGRKYVRISLGGVRDEAEIRGHRRTYVGALPGRIVQALRQCQTHNPVMVLDEIDKVGHVSHHGDPSAALLEVLDPEQNTSFVDHYLALPLDLSNILFICTANRSDTIPAALLDRMEMIDVSGYTTEEKLLIAKQHLVPKQERAHGFERGLRWDEDVLQALIQGWTREAGVRELERVIAAVCRRKAMERAEHVERADPGGGDGRVTLAELMDILGPEKYHDDVASRTTVPGVATGLAYTATGSGSILFIESTRMPGTGKLQLTGNLGDVIQESAHIAFSWLRSHASELGIISDHPDGNPISGWDIHLHVPGGAIPKDGPSAGIAMLASLTSLFLQRPIPASLGMTGELSLRGLVLPIGGVKEKLAAARRAGLDKVLIPERNKPDVEWDAPKSITDALEVCYVSTAWDVFEACWGEMGVSQSWKPRSGVPFVSSRL